MAQILMFHNHVRHSVFLPSFAFCIGLAFNHCQHLGFPVMLIFFFLCMCIHLYTSINPLLNVYILQLIRSVKLDQCLLSFWMYS